MGGTQVGKIAQELGAVQVRSSYGSGYNGSGVGIAFLDSGVMSSHSAFASGLAAVAREEGATILNFDRAGAVPVTPKSGIEPAMYLARPMFDADVVIKTGVKEGDKVVVNPRAYLDKLKSSGKAQALGLVDPRAPEVTEPQLGKRVDGFAARLLYHGAITHGTQLLDPELYVRAVLGARREVVRQAVEQRLEARLARRPAQSAGPHRSRPTAAWGQA